MGEALKGLLWNRVFSRSSLGRDIEAELQRDAATPGGRSTPDSREAPSQRDAPGNGGTDGPTEYSQAVFETNDIEAAKEIILTAEIGTTTHERWERETPYLVEAIGRELGLGESSCVLDYGCGIGRVAKGLIERYGCFVVGVDISAGMRQLAHQYVQSDRFVACAPRLLDAIVAQGFRSTHAVACWVIQHCPDPDADLARIEACLPTGGRFYVLNTERRWIPTNRGWATDKVSIAQLLERRFDRIAAGRLPESVTTSTIAQGTFTMTLQRRNRSPAAGIA